MDLLSAVLTVRPLDANPEPAPYWWGRAVQAMFLAAVQRRDPALSARLHDEQAPHPYTVSTLLGRFPAGRLDPSAVYTLRLTACEAPLCALLAELLAPGGELGAGAEIQLHGQPFGVEGAALTAEAHPWAGQSGYAQLIAAAMTRGDAPARRVTLQWSAPTAFRSNGRDIPLPIPELVFGGLLERWNAAAPVAFPPEARRYAAECLGVTRYNLSTRSVQSTDDYRRVGASGQVSFTAFTYDRYWMGVLHSLAAFSLYAGVGAGTAQGMGQCRALED